MALAGELGKPLRERSEDGCARVDLVTGKIYILALISTVFAAISYPKLF